MSLYALKPAFQSLLRPLVAGLFRLRCTANFVTSLAAALSLLLGALLWLHPVAPLFALLPLWCLIRMALNAIDGMLAREFGQRSVLGGFLNELGDVVSDVALLAPFMKLAGASTTLVWGAICLSIISELVGIHAAAAGGSRRYDGPLGKSDRAFVIGLLGLVVALGWVPVHAWNPIWIGFCALLLITTARRIRAALNEIPPIRS